MREINRFHGDGYGDREGVGRYTIAVHTSGRRLFVEFETQGRGGERTGTALLEVGLGKTTRAVLEEKVDRELLERELEQKIEAAAQRWTKRSDGLFVPAGPEDLIIVEKPDADRVQVFSRSDERGEEVEKLAVRVEHQSCTCPLPITARIGCSRLRGESRCVTRQEFLTGLRRSGLLPAKPRTS